MSSRIAGRVAMVLLAVGLGGTAQDAPYDFGRDTQWAKYHPESQAICRSVADRQIPRADIPDAKAAASLKGCDAEALYYGIGRPADPSKARQCAILEAQSRKPEDLYSGRNILMMVYANGRGGRRDLDLAIHLSCGADTAPAEHDNRVKTLTYMKQHPEDRDEIDVCTDVTSGLAMGACADHDNRLAAAGRMAEQATLARAWSPAAKAAFADLKRKATAFVQVRMADETYLGGTIHWARMADVEAKEDEAFQTLLRQVAKGQPLGGNRGFKAADVRLNATYREVLGGPFDTGDEDIKAEGVRRTQRAWIAYRDAWLRFAALAYPSTSADRLAAVLTEARERELKQIHLDPDADDDES